MCRCFRCFVGSEDSLECVLYVCKNVKRTCQDPAELQGGEMNVIFIVFEKNCLCVSMWCSVSGSPTSTSWKQATGVSWKPVTTEGGHSEFQVLHQCHFYSGCGQFSN